mgnify:CR=1 FL=1
MDIVPPEVPKLEKKKSFLQKLFSHKQKQENKIEDKITKPSLDIPDTKISELPELPSLEPNEILGADNSNMTNVLLPKSIPENLPHITKTVGKSKNVGKNKLFHKIDETKNFDWTDSINEQSDIITDNIRYNEDINNVLITSDQHIEDQKKVLNSKVLTLPENLPDIKFDNPEVPDIKMEAVPMLPKERRFFNNLDKEHKKLRNELKKNMKNFTRAGFIRLLKQYDDKIESIIEQKQIEYSKKGRELSELSKSLAAKQKELTELQQNLKKLQKRLDAKEKSLEESVTKHVEKQLVNRTKKEKAMLRKELQKTISMNKELKKRIDTITKDRKLLDNIREKLIDEHRKKMNALQETYEHKLAELNKERTEFEERRKNALSLLHKAELIRKEKENLDRLKEIVAQKKEALNDTLYEDRELKRAIENAESKLAEERTNLDNMIFSKYIKWKLSGAEDNESITEILKDPKVDEINNMIVECRSKVLNGNIIEAKKMYNAIKHKFETYNIDDYNKNMLFNSIRELYSDIQIAVLKP